VSGFSYDAARENLGSVPPTQPSPAVGVAPRGTGQSSSEQANSDVAAAVITGGTHTAISASYNAGTRAVSLTNTDRGSTAVTTHVAASDPHGDRAYADTAIATHAGASDPHGDRAYADGLVANRARVVAVPATATSTGAVGDIAFDASHIYVCHATNTWKRVAIATW
jgi:hypothetical protein